MSGAGTHYLDITGEADVFEALAARDAEARAAGRMRPRVERPTEASQVPLVRPPEVPELPPDAGHRLPADPRPSQGR